ncbi:MAG: trimeric intracellular cation channel family protein, partial [Ilumatobacteraceae bacterium]
MASGTDIVTILDFIGISVFAASGALLALERGFDLVGLVALGTVTALGGGVLRDVIINEGLPASFESATPIAVAVIAALV